MAVSKDDNRKKKAVDKSPMNMTKKSESVVESGKEDQTIKKEDAKELRGALQTTKQVPSYQKVTIKSESQNEADTIEETKGITSVTDSLEGKTILEKQNEKQQPKAQDTETLEVQSTVPTEEISKQGLNVQDIGSSRKDSNLDMVELPSNMDYVFPFTYAMTIWQDFALSAVNTYNDFARELSRLHSNWMSIFLNFWQSSNYEKKD
jgi:hypothetical protein